MLNMATQITIKNQIVIGLFKLLKIIASVFDLSLLKLSTKSHVLTITLKSTTAKMHHLSAWVDFAEIM